MNIFPHSLVGRVVLVVWLVACVAVLVFAFQAREIHDADIAFAYLMLFLTFPFGIALATLIGVLFSILYSLFGVVVPSGFIPNLASWFFFVAVGYFQWFILIPWIYRKVRKASNPRLEADAP